jgi:RNA polymerase sigma-70 factor (ECF subfamily)
MLLKRIKAKIAGPPHSEEVSDANLVCLMTDAKTLEEQVTEAFELLRMPLYHYLMAVYGNPAEAEELAQEAFLRLYSSLRDGQTIRNVRFWIFRVAHNLALDRRRHNQFMTPLDADSWEELVGMLPDQGLNPEQNILRREKFARLFDGLKKLSIHERQALYLRSNGFKYNEIAEIMSVGSSTVGEFLRRGIKKLSEQAGD